MGAQGKCWRQQQQVGCQKKLIKLLLGLEGMMGVREAKNAENKKAEEMMPIIIIMEKKKKKKLDLDIIQKRT